MTTIRLKAVPILRIAEVSLAKEFYGEFLGCTLDWEHYYEQGAPVYMQMSRGELVLQLSQNARFREGTIIFVESTGIEELHAELTQRADGRVLPSISVTPWGTKQVELEDPFGNLLRFNAPNS